MATQFRNFSGKRYYKTLSGMTRRMALRKAKQKRKDGLLARASPDPDHKGQYAVYIREKGK